MHRAISISYYVVTIGGIHQNTHYNTKKDQRKMRKQGEYMPKWEILKYLYGFWAPTVFVKTCI